MMSPGNSGVFPAPERGDFSKNSGVLQIVGRVTFLCDGLVGLVREIVMSVTSVGRSHHRMSDIGLPFPHLCIISSKKCQKVKIFIDGKVANLV